jgi:hypothetical protein
VGRSIISLVTDSFFFSRINCSNLEYELPFVVELLNSSRTIEMVSTTIAGLMISVCGRSWVRTPVG